MKRIGVISDTHIPARARQIPEQVFELFRGVDLILHAGDLIQLDVLAWLETIAPVYAVQGNVDPDAVRAHLPLTRQITVDGLTIGMVHILSARADTYGEAARDQFPHAHCVVFGHSHKPYNQTHYGKVVFNPGSPTDKRTAPTYTVGMLEVSTGIIARHLELQP